MKRVFISLFMLMAATAFGADSARLDYGIFFANYDVSLVNGMLTGSQENLGNGSGRVELERKDGNWMGRFGFNQITSRSMKKRSETKMSYEFSVLPGGHYVAYIERKGDKTQVTLSLPNGAYAYSTLKNGRYLTGDNRVVGMNLSKENETTWSGLTRVGRGRSYESAQTTLTAEGALNPEMLASTDPALYVILYVLPYNYVH